jgi:hypothetical protein
MIRKFNYMGRKRIPRNRITINMVSTPNGPASFDASFDLKGLNLPQKAKIYVEAYRRSFFQRFVFGTIENLKPPLDRYLGDLDARALVMFRIKIVDAAGKGRILAVADKIMPRRLDEEPMDRLCLLPVDFVDLGQSIWRLDLAGDWPNLLLNSRIDETREIARSNVSFLSLVYPEVVRQVLHKIVVDEDHTDPESDPDDWMSLWLNFTYKLLKVGYLPPSGESEPIRQEKLKWVEEAVEAFCSENQMLNKFKQSLLPGEQ